MGTGPASSSSGPDSALTCSVGAPDSTDSTKHKLVGCLSGPTEVLTVLLGIKKVTWWPWTFSLHKSARLLGFSEPFSVFSGKTPKLSLERIEARLFRQFQCGELSLTWLWLITQSPPGKWLTSAQYTGTQASFLTRGWRHSRLAMPSMAEEMNLPARFAVPLQYPARSAQPVLL